MFYGEGRQFRGVGPEDEGWPKQYTKPPQHVSEIPRETLHAHHMRRSLLLREQRMLGILRERSVTNSMTIVFEDLHSNKFEEFVTYVSFMIAMNGM